MDVLLTSLLDLLYELRSEAPLLMIGGGFGLYLKRRHLQDAGSRTLLGELPEPRATNDLDLFIRAEVLADLSQTRRIAGAIGRLGYEPVQEARFMQWKRSLRIGDVEQTVKIDLLVGPLGEYRRRLKVSAPRARPRGGVALHAHCVEEALGIDIEPLELRIGGVRSSGQAYEGVILVPQAFPYLMMKLFAFSDRKEDGNEDMGRHHALDLYTIVGMLTEAEYSEMRTLGRRFEHDPHMQKARQIVHSDFSTPTRVGVLRLREHPLYRREFEIERFIDVMLETFPLN